MENKKTILLAEDEQFLREVYTRALSDNGFEVIAAENGEDALRKLKDNYERLSLVVLDIVMPKMDGFDVLKEMKRDKKYDGIHVIMSTSLSDPDDKKEAMDLGAEKYFVKADRTPQQLTDDIIKIVAG